MVEIGKAQAQRLDRRGAARPQDLAQRILAHAAGELERERYRVRRELLEETVERATGARATSSSATHAREAARIGRRPAGAASRRGPVLKETIARRYSAALFAVAQEKSQPSKIVAELDAFVRALERQIPTLARILRIARHRPRAEDSRSRARARRRRAKSSPISSSCSCASAARTYMPHDRAPDARAARQSRGGERGRSRRRRRCAGRLADARAPALIGLQTDHRAARKV